MPSKKDLLNVATKRQNLDMRIDSFICQAPQYLSDAAWENYQLLTEAPPSAELMTDCQGYCTDSDDDDNPFISRPPVIPSYAAETRPLPLPSTFGHAQIVSLELTLLAAKELELREGQANDELSLVRMALGEKSFLFRKDVRLAKSKNKKGRAWSKIHAINRRVQAHRQVYNAARDALIALGCSAATQSRYQVLLRNQLKVSTAVVKSGVGSAEGGSRRQDEPLAWFWTMNVSSDVEGSEMLRDCTSFTSFVISCFDRHSVYRVHWLRAHARHARWAEELSITSHEMVWIQRYFTHRAECWIQRSAEVNISYFPGTVAYARRQAASWANLAATSAKLFQVINPRVGEVWGM